jgi:hypothetical protein
MYSKWHKPQLRNMAWLLVGIYLSRSVHLNRIAGKIPGHAKRVSITRRLSRFLDGMGLTVRQTYEPVIRPVLEHLARTGVLRLIIDGSKVGFNHQLLMVSVAYRRRAVLIAWTWVRCNRGHSSTHVQLALLTYVRTLLPSGVKVEVAGDCEFGAIGLMSKVTLWGWLYALRQKPTHQVKTDNDSDWQRISALVTKPGDSCWVPNALLTAKHQFTTNILAHWAKGEDEPCLIATNFPTAQSTLGSYSRRMWIEELFGDLKGHGFDLESTHLDDIIKLSRLTLAVVLLYVWLVAYGSKVIKNGKRSLVDRSDRRHLSIFQIGLRFIERCLTNALSFHVGFSLVI